MFFVVSKVLLFLILPPSCILILLAFGFLMRKCFIGRLFIISGFALLYGLSINPVAERLITPLETSYPPLKNIEVPVDAIVVLGGGARDLSWIGLAQEPSEPSLERLVKGVSLYRVVRRPIIFAGGTGLPVRTTIREADAMARTALELGVPAKDFSVENKSRNTLENAKSVRGMLRGNRILLVTSAFHMKRSAAMFRKQGFEVTPAPTGYRSEHRAKTYLSFIPSAGNLSTSSLALSEYLSLFWYGVSGEL